MFVMTIKPLNLKLALMEKGFLHLHVTVVVLFMLFFAYKLFLLLSNKKESLSSFRQKTKVVDMILGSLIIATGGYLLFATGNHESYIITKIVLTLAVIPLGIIGMKKENKVLAVLTMLILVYVFFVGKTRSIFLKKEKITISTNSLAASPIAKDMVAKEHAILNQNSDVALENGKVIFTQVCAACHGVDGKLGISGAKDLTLSVLSHEEVIQTISEGKGLMQAYKDLLSEQDIASVALYVESLRIK
jgi:cytochrome c553